MLKRVLNTPLYITQNKLYCRYLWRTLTCKFTNTRWIVIPKNLAKFTEKNCDGVSLKESCSPTFPIYWKKTCIARVFLWVLWSFSWQLFYITPRRLILQILLNYIQPLCVDVYVMHWFNLLLIMLAHLGFQISQKD